VQRKRAAREREHERHVPAPERLRLEDRLQRRDVHERELRRRRRADGAEQHPVPAERAPEAAVLDRRHEVEEHERRERLHTSGSAGRAHVRRMYAERTMVCSRRDMWASPRA
jgi:hypothetical protein